MSRQQYFPQPEEASAALLLLSDVGGREGSFDLTAESRAGQAAVCCGEFDAVSGERQYLVADLVHEPKRGWRVFSWSFGGFEGTSQPVDFLFSAGGWPGHFRCAGPVVGDQAASVTKIRVHFPDDTPPLTVTAAGRWVAVVTEQPHPPPYVIELVDAEDRVVWETTAGSAVADIPAGGKLRLTPREIARLIVLGPADMPPSCTPRASCIGDLTIERAEREHLLSDAHVLVECGYLAGEQFGFERSGSLVAQHGVLLFGDTRGARRAYGALAEQKPPDRQLAEVTVGEEAVLGMAQSTRQLLWRVGRAVQVLMMRGEEQREIVNLARRLSERARRATTL